MVLLDYLTFEQKQTLLSFLNETIVKESELEDGFQNLKILLEDGKLVDLKENYLQQLTFLKNDPTKMDKSWIHCTNDGVFFVSKLSKFLPVIRSTSTQKKEFLHIVLDQSSSMSSMNDAAFQGAKEVVESMPPTSTITLTTFSTQVTVGTDMSQTQAMESLTTRVASGQTALYDAIIEAIRVEEGRCVGSITTIVVVTDGMDNVSKSNVHEAKLRVENFQSSPGHRVLFLGSNQDACLTASTLGIPAERALTYGNDALRMREAMRAVSENNQMYRSLGTDQFTSAQRMRSG